MSPEPSASRDFDRLVDEQYARDRGALGWERLEGAARAVLKTYDADFPHHRGSSIEEREAMLRLRKVLEDS